MHWSNNCSNPFSYGYNSTLESRLDCPNYNPFNDQYFCQQGNNSKSLSPVNSLTSKYDNSLGSAYNRISNLQSSSNQIKMWTELDPQTKAAAEASWGIVFPMQVQTSSSNKLQWSYDVMNSNKSINNSSDRDKCVSSDKFKANNGLYSTNDFMISQNSLKSDLNGFNQSSKGIRTNSQIKSFDSNIESYPHLTAPSVNPLNIETLEQTLSNVSLSDTHFNTFTNLTNNQAPSPSKKTWALIVGKQEKPTSLTLSNLQSFSLRTNNKPELKFDSKSKTNENSNSSQISISNKINLSMCDFDSNLKNAKFFVIKSYSEDDVYRSIKYQIWCSTETGNRRLDNAYSNAGGEIPIYLFFSVNGSGHFCGVAEMVSSVDYKTRASVWAQGKWKGQFRVRWVFVKDVPNSQLRHIRIETNENKPVTNSRDVTEIPLEKGRQVFKIIANFKATSSIYDDFDHYEQRELSESNQ